jgi:hypothetical protein
MKYITLAAMILFGLPGCVAQERIVTKEVLVPVPTKAAPPDWLMVDYKPDDIPEFVSPSDPKASSALTSEGERALRLIITDLQARLAEWRAWAN